MFTHEMIKSFNQLEMDVYNYIISNEEKVVYMKVRELAEEVHVSTTTILRFCKKVGCEGYSEFRLKLKQEVNSKEQFALFVIDIRLLPLLFNFSANISVCSVSPDTDNAIVAVLSPFPRNTGVNGSSIANENQPTLLKYLAPYFPIIEEFPTPTNKANCSLAKMSDCNINYYVSEYKKDENYDLTSQMAVVFILELIGRELEGVHNDTDDLFQNDMEDLFH